MTNEDELVGDRALIEAGKRLKKFGNSKPNEDEFEKQVREILGKLNYVGDGDNFTEEEAVTAIMNLKAQILKENFQSRQTDKDFLADYREQVYAECKEKLKQNNQRNSVGVPVSKKETENPLSELSDEKLNLYDKALIDRVQKYSDLGAELPTDHEDRKWIDKDQWEACQAQQETEKEQERRKKQLSKESKETKE